ncbi:MAG: HWE histidine kinase domain-containing protein [Caulobacteraceae bacterium]
MSASAEASTPQTSAARIALLEEALARESRRAAALNRIAAAIGANFSLESVVQAVVDGGVELSGAAFGAFFYNVIDPTGEAYTLYALSGAPREAFSRYPMPRKTAVFADTFDGTSVVISEDITHDPRYGKNAPYFGMPKDHLPVRSYLAVPVISRRGEVLGGLFFGHSEVGTFQMPERDVMTGLAAQAAVAIDNVRLHETSLAEIAERARALETQRLLLNELNHRVKNTLATVQSIAGQTARGASSPAAFVHDLEGRLAALSETHNLLNVENWQGLNLSKLLTVVLAPYDPSGARVIVEGDGEVRLRPNAGLALAMGFHELATNAAKYGALSQPTGEIHISWRHMGAKPPRITVEWSEHGGPEAGEPGRRGFGTRLLERGLAGELAGTVKLDYLPQGVICRMDLPLDILEPAA